MIVLFTYYKKDNLETPLKIYSFTLLNNYFFKKRF